MHEYDIFQYQISVDYNHVIGAYTSFLFFFSTTLDLTESQDKSLPRWSVL